MDARRRFPSSVRTNAQDGAGALDAVPLEREREEERGIEEEEREGEDVRLAGIERGGRGFRFRPEGRRDSWNEPSPIADVLAIESSFERDPSSLFGWRTWISARRGTESVLKEIPPIRTTTAIVSISSGNDACFSSSSWSKASHRPWMRSCKPGIPSTASFDSGSVGASTGTLHAEGSKPNRIAFANTCHSGTDRTRRDDRMSSSRFTLRQDVPLVLRAWKISFRVRSSRSRVGIHPRSIRRSRIRRGGFSRHGFLVQIST